MNPHSNWQNDFQTNQSLTCYDEICFEEIYLLYTCSILVRRALIPYTKTAKKERSSTNPQWWLAEMIENCPNAHFAHIVVLCSPTIATLLIPTRFGIDRNRAEGQPLTVYYRVESRLENLATDSTCSQSHGINKSFHPTWPNKLQNPYRNISDSMSVSCRANSNGCN